MSTGIPARNIRVKRIYEPVARTDGRRVLVDRLWPRGVSKDAAALDDWLQEIAPSERLREWFNHDPVRWQEFRRRYSAELRNRRDLVRRLRQFARQAPVTLLYGARDEKHNQAVALRAILLGR
ncbi:MAG: DUF488 family protein [Proteobacteria bacterium]|nr:DUF488 family protein [Pseudomonadota bacterium]